MSNIIDLSGARTSAGMTQAQLEIRDGLLAVLKSIEARVNAGETVGVLVMEIGPKDLTKVGTATINGVVGTKSLCHVISMVGAIINDNLP